MIGMKKICGICKKSGGYSISPLMQSIFSQEMGVDTEYREYNIDGDISVAIESMYKQGIYGLNITMPYKRSIMPYLSGLSNEARKIAAVNTLIRTKDGYYGDNTDKSGLIKALYNSDIELRDRHIILLGSGGAAYAAAYACVDEGVGSISIYSRNSETAEELARRLAATDSIPVSCNELNCLDDKTHVEEHFSQKKSIIIQATPVGMYPHISDRLLSRNYVHRMCDTAIDLIYNPLQTGFLQAAKEAGLICLSGLDMLIYQGAASWELWHGVSIGDELINIVRKKLIRELAGM